MNQEVLKNNEASLEKSKRDDLNYKRDKADYWSDILTGDPNTIPYGIREKVGVPYPKEEDEQKVLMHRIMRSWAVDHLDVSREEAARNWGEIRAKLASELSVDPDDRQLFYALSERLKIDKEVKSKLNNVYSDVYHHTLTKGDGFTPDEELWNEIPKQYHESTRIVIERSRQDALAEYNRLKPMAEQVVRGVEGILTNETSNATWWTDINRKYNPVLLPALTMGGYGDRYKTVFKLSDVSEEDRRKIYAIAHDELKKDPRFEGKDHFVVRLFNGTLRGLDNIENYTEQFIANSAARGISSAGKWANYFFNTSTDGTEKLSRTVANAASLSEELRQFAHEGVSSLYVEGDNLVEEILLDASHAAPMSALAFCGMGGILTLGASETGRHMSEARQMNPDGDYQSQMNAAVSSGVINTLLSVGMARIGMQLAENSFRNFKGTYSSVSGAVKGSAKAGGAHMARDIGLMAVENKLQEVVQYGAQEYAAYSSNKESGVDWDEWSKRQLSFKAQIREAGTMLPILLIGAGKVSLRHFKDAKGIVADGVQLEMMGVPKERIEGIVLEPDIELRNELFRKAVIESPMWGSLFFGKKAFEWAKILEDPRKPLFQTEQEVRDFLNMGPIRGEKKWAKTDSNPDLAKLKENPDPEFQSLLVHDRWRMRSGVPQVTQVRDGFKAVYGEDIKVGKQPVSKTPEEALKSWNVNELQSERNDLNIRSARDRGVLPERLRENDVFDPNADVLRKQYLSDRMQDIIYRPYRMLMLKYSPERIAQFKWSTEKCDQITRAEGEALRSTLYEGVMRAAEGQDWQTVSKDVGLGIWERWVGDDAATNYKNKLWVNDTANLMGENTLTRYPDLERVKSLVDRRENVPDGDMVKALYDVSDYYANTTESQRMKMPGELREVSRLVWKTQGDVRTLADLIPNLSDFDVLTGRGYGPDQAYSSLLQKNLEVTPDVLKSYVKNLPEELLNPGEGKQRPFKYYEFINDASELLGNVSKNHLEKITGTDGNDYWRVKYPNGKFSAWHETENMAKQDLAGHLATVFSPEGFSKKSLVSFLIRNKLNKTMEVRMDDINVHRLMEGKSGGVLFDDLSARAAADLTRQYYGKRSMRLPGEEIIIHDVGTVEAETQLGRSAIRERSDIHEKYVGPIEDMGVDASNESKGNMKGLIMHRFDLFNAKNPLAIIEDKAEIMWDRLIRSGQMSERDAWTVLHKMGRTEHPDKMTHKGEYMRLIEELSQLSKEYYIGNLDHSFVPESVSAWARYAVSRPMPVKVEVERIKSQVYDVLKKKQSKRTYQDMRVIDEWVQSVSTEEMRNLAIASKRMPELLSKSQLPESFVSMLKDTAGMNESSRVERFWSMRGKDHQSGEQPLMERYFYGLKGARLFDLLPEHLANDVANRLSDLNGGVMSLFTGRDSHTAARKELVNIEDRLREFPQINRWHYDQETGKYLKLVSKKDKASVFEAIDESYERHLDRQPGWEKTLEKSNMDRSIEITDDYYVRESDSLPAKWSTRENVVRAVKALSIIRDEMASRPVPSEDGIKWKGEVYNSESAKRPSSVPATWNVDSPLLSAIIPILESGQSSRASKAAHTPMLHDVGECMESVKNCIKYVDPDDGRHTIRVMPGTPEAPNREARHPHVIHSYHGVYLDVNGKPVGAGNMRDSYIPLEKFKNEHVDIDMSPREILEYRRAVRERILDELSSEDIQKKNWWNSDDGDSTFCESVIRLYEESGMAEAYSKGAVDIDNPAFVETIRFVGHVLNHPGTMGSSLEAGMDWHKALLSEARKLKELYQEAERGNGKE